METTPSNKRIHPLMAAAAVSVVLVSLIGVAAITGILPNSHGTGASVAPPTSLAAAPSNPTSIPPETNPMADNTPAPAENTEKRVAVPAKVQHHPRVVEERSHARSEPVRVAAAEPPRQICYDCGTVESVQVIQQAAKPSGIGAVAGAVLGGVLGNQVGGGDGRKLATVAGAVGGGFAGNEVEKRTHTTATYDVRVRMEDGSVRSFPQSSQNGWRAGDRVRVVNGALTSQG
jgi:outer membrane lipoprotein SlyB